MSTHRNEKFANQDVVIDGNRYEGCVFSNSTLVYGGGELPAFVNCTFRQTGLRLTDVAQQTTTYLSLLNATELRPAVGKLLGQVERGALASSQRPSPPTPLATGRNYGQLAGIGLSLMAVAIVLGVALWYGFIYFPTNVTLNADPAQPLYREPLMAQMPALPDSLSASYDQIRADQIDRISTYGWVDEQAGIAKIPVDVAAELIVEQGLPVREE